MYVGGQQGCWEDSGSTRRRRKRQRSHVYLADGMVECRLAVGGLTGGDLQQGKERACGPEWLLLHARNVRSTIVWHGRDVFILLAAYMTFIASKPIHRSSTKRDMVLPTVKNRKQHSKRVDAPADIVI